MKIIVHDEGMVNIEDDNLLYANIRNMYTENRNGAGIQINEELEPYKDDINECCDKISALAYKLQDLLKNAMTEKQLG